MGGIPVAQTSETFGETTFDAQKLSGRSGCDSLAQQVKKRVIASHNITHSLTVKRVLHIIWALYYIHKVVSVTKDMAEYTSSCQFFYPRFMANAIKISYIF